MSKKYPVVILMRKRDIIDFEYYEGTVPIQIIIPHDCLIKGKKLMKPPKQIVACMDKIANKGKPCSINKDTCTDGKIILITHGWLYVWVKGKTQ